LRIKNLKNENTITLKITDIVKANNPVELSKATKSFNRYRYFEKSNNRDKRRE